MRKQVHTANGDHIRALYDAQGALDCFVPVRGPVQDESEVSDPQDQEAARMIEAGRHRK